MSKFTIPGWNPDKNWAAIQGFIDAGGRFVLVSPVSKVVEEAWDPAKERWIVSFLELMQIVSQGHQTF